MRYLSMILGMLGWAANACSEDGLTIDNARKLRELLTAGYPPVSIEALPPQRGCGPADCRIDIGGVSIDREKGLLIDASNNDPIQLRPQVSGELPELDWEPLGGYSVTHDGKRWGSCLEFSHTGLGKSGRYQRWTSVVLVPWRENRPGGVAYRFVGYWAGCDLITAGDKADEVRLPIVERLEEASNTGALRIVWHACTVLVCGTNQDPRRVTEDANSETGALIVAPLPPPSLR